MAVEPTLEEIKAYGQFINNELDNLINTHLPFGILNLKSQIGLEKYTALSTDVTPSGVIKAQLANEAITCMILEKVLPHSNQYAFTDTADYQDNFRDSTQLSMDDLNFRISQYIAIYNRNIEVINKDDATQAEPEVYAVLMGGASEEA